MTRRAMVLFFLVAVAASPLVWMSVDAEAGNTLLALTSGAKTRVVSSNTPALVPPVR